MKRNDLIAENSKVFKGSDITTVWSMAKKLKELMRYFHISNHVVNISWKQRGFYK
jgi:hypothetical protein